MAIADSAGGFDNSFYNKILVWDVVNWCQVAEFDGCSKSVDDVAFSPTGDALACVGDTTERFMDGEIKVWNASNWTPSQTIVQDELSSLRRVAFSPDGRWLATGSALSEEGKKLQLWDLSTGKCLREFGLLANGVQGLDFSPDGKLLAAGVVRDRSVSVWLIPSGRKRWKVRAHSQATRLPVLFSPDGKLLASCADKNVALWDVKSGKSYALLKGHPDDVRSVTFSPDGKLLISSSRRDFWVWDVASAVAVGRDSVDYSNFIALGFDADRRILNAVHTINDEVCLRQYAFHPEVLKPAASRRIATIKKPSREEQRWITAVLADPENDAPRLEYAKWLEDRGDSRGEFIRLQCQLASNRKKRLLNRERQLLEEHFQEWTAPLASLQIGPGDCEFRRGFLWKLQLNDISVTNKSLEVLQAVPELEHLDLQGSKVTDKGMPAVAAIENLRYLDLSETAVTPRSLEKLRGLKRLIRPHNYKWGNQPIGEVEKLKQARNRRFLRLPVDEQRAAAIRALEILVGYLPQDKQGTYKRISYSQSWASDADLVYLQAIPEVEELDFFECRAVTQQGLKHLACLPNLKKLELNESGVTDLAPLRHLTLLEELNVDSLESLDPQSFRHLTKLENLRVLTVRFCNLGDEILPHIAKCTSLRELDVIYNHFTAAGLQHLAGLDLKKFEHD